MIDALIMTVALNLPQEQPSTPRIGYATSEYRGKWYSQKWESVRKCIMHRESRFNYSASSKISSAMGSYQFLDNFWRESLVWMMLDEQGNRHEIKQLRHQPINKWSRYYQDRAFFTVWRHGAGAKHWYLQESRCFSGGVS